jgi:hypothetical protein
MWIETFEIHFEALPWYLSGRADYNQVMPQETSSTKTVKIRTDILYWKIPHTSQQLYGCSHLAQFKKCG